MTERKTEVVNLRMTPRVKQLLRAAASREHRTLSNMLEVLIEGYFEPADAAANPVNQHRALRATASSRLRSKRASHR